MDPLSVSASIASLIGAADTVVRRLYHYVKAVKGAEKQISALSMEITTLYGVLSSLHLVASRFESESSELTMKERSMQIDHIHACYTTLDSIRSLLQKDDPSTTQSRMESIRRRLHWPLSESKTKEFIDAVGRYKQTLTLALNADTMAALLQGLSQQKDISYGIEDIKNRMIASSIMEDRRKVLKSLIQDVDPHKYLASVLRLRQMGTGLWIRDSSQFQNWINSSNARLFLTGIPGAGKTVLCAVIIEEILKRTQGGKTGSALAYYFCDYKDPATNDPRNILASLVVQFAAQDEECYKVAQTLYENHCLSEGSRSSYTTEDLKQCLLDMVKTLDHAFIVVDALDECVNDRASVLEILHCLNDFPNENTKTLYTGRDELDIQTALSDYDRFSMAANSHDIRLFVDSEIARRTKNATLRIRDHALKEEIRERLVTKAEGMFRWVVCQIDHICSLSNDKSRRKALDTLPPDLPTTYERVLDRVNASNKENRLTVERALRWILWSAEPLSLRALSEAVSVSIGDTALERDAITDPEAILQWCGSLVRMTPGLDTLELAHYSVKEFLERIDARARPNYLTYRADTVLDNLNLAKTCLTYLCFDDFDIDHFEDPEKMWPYMQKYKLLRYCTLYWDRHARFKEDDESLLELLHQFLNPSRTNQYLSWISWIASINANKLVVNDVDDEGKETGMNHDRSRILFSNMADSSPLHWAVTLSLPSVCQWLISEHCDVNQFSLYFGTPLLLAITPSGLHAVGRGNLRQMNPQEYPQTALGVEISRRCKYETVKILIDAGADCNARILTLSSKRHHILFEALSAGCDFNFVRLLLNSGSLCDKDSLDFLASESGEGLRVFRELQERNVENGIVPHFRNLAVHADMNWDHVFSINEAQNPNHRLSEDEIRPLFFNAAKFGRVQVLERVVILIRGSNGGLDINMKSGENNTALHVASSHDRPEIVKILIREEISGDEPDIDGKTALMVAVDQVHHECAAILVRHGCDVRKADNEGITALHMASAHRTTRMLELLMSSSPVNEGGGDYPRTKSGQSLLHFAALHGSLPNIHYILQHFPEASPHERLQSGAGTLHLACASGLPDVVEFFLDYGLTIDDWTSDYASPVYYAIMALENENSNSIGVIKLLHSRGANFDTSQSQGDIPLFHLIRLVRKANSQCFLHCFTFILDHTKDINYCDEEGFNALHWLALSQPDSCSNVNCERMCRVLLERGCSMTQRDRHGDTTFQVFIRTWSELDFDSAGVFLFRYEVSDDEGSERDTVPEYDEIRSEVGITMLIIKQTKADPKILGPPEQVSCRGLSLLSLAVRTADQTFVKEVLQYDNDVDRRDTLPGLGSFPRNTPLEWLCTGFFPDRGLIRNFLSLSTDLEARGPDGLSAVHIAASCGHVEVLTEMLEMGVDIDCLSSKAMSPIMYAIVNRKIQTIKFLYENGARTIISDRVDSVRISCQAGAKTVLAVLFDMAELQLDWNRTYKDLIEIGPRSGGTSVFEHTMSYFHLTAYLGYKDVLDWFLARKIIVDVNAVVDEARFTALYLVAGDKSSSKGTLSFLLSKGADLSLKSGVFNWTSLHAAAEAGNIEHIQVLLSHGADPSILDSRKFTPRLVAIENNNFDAAQVLADHEMAQNKIANKPNLQIENTNVLQTEELNLQDQFSRLSPALHSCAALGDVMMVRRLLDDGADVDSCAPDCSTPAMIAAEKGHLDVLDLLKERGADFSARDFGGGSALHYACWGRRTTVIPGLLECGLEFTDTDLEDVTSLHSGANGFRKPFHMFIMRHASVKKLPQAQIIDLVQRAATYKNVEMIGWVFGQLDTTQKREVLEHEKPLGTLMQIAALCGLAEVFDILLDAGADINRANEKRDPPLACAASMGRFEAVQVLAKKGARLMWEMTDGTKCSAIDSANKYPRIQQWLRDFYKEKVPEIATVLAVRQMETTQEEGEDQTDA